MEPIAIDEITKIVKKERQESFQAHLDEYTKHLNNCILDAAREGLNHIDLFNFYYYPGQVSSEMKEQEVTKILESLLNGEDRYLKNIAHKRYDAPLISSDNKAYFSVLKLFQEKGYDIKFAQGIGYDFKIKNTSKYFFQKPNLTLKYHEFDAFAALGCPSNTEEIKKLMTKGNNKFIHVDQARVALYWVGEIVCI